MNKAFETVEEALYWAVECSLYRHSPRMAGINAAGGRRPCEMVDIFNVFKNAYRNKLLSKGQYTLYLYAKKYGDLPPENCLYPEWMKMIKIVEPLMIDKGIIIKS